MVSSFGAKNWSQITDVGAEHVKVAKILAKLYLITAKDNMATTQIQRNFREFFLPEVTEQNLPTKEMVIGEIEKMGIDELRNPDRVVATVERLGIPAIEFGFCGICIGETAGISYYNSISPRTFFASTIKKGESINYLLTDWLVIYNYSDEKEKKIDFHSLVIVPMEALAKK